jgi:hypothetical protein
MHQIARYSNQVMYLKHVQIVYCGERERGIDRFLEDMHQADATPADERTDWSQIHGSGKIVFTAARFRNASGVEVTTIDVGDAVTLEIDYERRAVLNSSPVLDIVIRDREGLVYQGTNLLSNQPFALLKSKGCFQVHFQNVPVMSTHVDFFFAVMDQQTSELFDWKRNLRLNIRGTRAQQGRIAIDTEWSCL